MLQNLTKKCFIIFILIFYTLAIANSIVYAQGTDNPAEPPSDEASDPGRAPDRTQPIATKGDKILGPVGTGKPGEGCLTPITLNKSDIVDNVDYDVPYVPGWLEGGFINTMTGSLGDSGAIFEDIENTVNSSQEGSSLCLESATPSTTDPEEVKAGKCVCEPKQSFTIKDDFCSKVAQSERGDCQTCANSNEGVWTALGCIKFNLGLFITGVLFKLSIGIGGIIALGCILYATVLLQISRGEPDKIQHARELITSCIIGLLLIIFSIFILRFIGVDILKLQDLGAPLK